MGEASVVDEPVSWFRVSTPAGTSFRAVALLLRK